MAKAKKVGKAARKAIPLGKARRGSSTSAARAIAAGRGSKTAAATSGDSA